LIFPKRFVSLQNCELQNPMQETKANIDEDCYCSNDNISKMFKSFAKSSVLRQHCRARNIQCPAMCL